jgi:ferric-dicitrate binding protein FerR (iron transport regulator)
MADDREPLSERQVGAVVRRLSEEHALRVVARDRSRAWDRIESSIPPHAVAGSSSGGRRVALFAGVVAVAAAAVLALGFRADSQLSYELRGGSSEAGVIEAKRGEATVSLSDGSSILAENQTRFSVDVVGRNAALTRLVSGKLHVRVQHNEDTSYRFIAGPYEVRVVGTEFDMAWDPRGAGLSLSMSKGEVRLAEPGGKLRTLKAGQAVRLPATQQLAESVARRASEEPAPAPAPPRVEAPRNEPIPPEAAPSAARSGWDSLVAKGQFADVVREAETLGVDTVTRTRGTSDLKALGQAARYVGKRALSMRAFNALRERNRGTDAARQAAFFLGRLQEEQGNQVEALRWLNTYVAEAPRGVYAAEAYGRRLSLTERQRGRVAALPLAREYLERFPEGAYAQSARAIVEAR